MAASHHGQTQAAAPLPTALQLAPSTSAQRESSKSPQQHLSLHDLRTIAADIKDTLSEALSELRLDIHAKADRVHEVEKVTAPHDTVLHRVTHRIDTNTLQLTDLQHHMEDLDNWGRHHNLQVRGLPESVDAEQVTATVTGLFNDLLDRPAQTAVEMERIYRALRPKGRDTDSPRDILCCLVDFKLKVEILRKAGNRIQLSYGGSDIHIYQDLSSITLQHRKVLKPLLDTLHSRGIHYC